MAKRIICIILMLCMFCTMLVACDDKPQSADNDDADGTTTLTPTIEISDDGYWVINGTKTEVKALGKDGEDGKDGVTPTVEINASGYWVINGDVTEVKAAGTDGATPTIEINAEGYWVINGAPTSVKAAGKDGADGKDGKDGKDGTTPTIEINASGYWVINGNPTSVKAVGQDGADGADGADGTSPTIVSCTRTSTSADGSVDTYTMTFSDGHTTTFNIYRTVAAVITVKDISYTTSGNETVVKFTYTDDTFYELTVEHTKGSAETNAMLAYTSAHNNGYVGEFGDFVLDGINAIFSEFGNSKQFSHTDLVETAMPKIVKNWSNYVSVNAQDIELDKNPGYVAMSGYTAPNDNYTYSQKLAVSEGDTVNLTRIDGNDVHYVHTIAYLCAYDISGNPVEASGTSWSDTYTVPAGITHIIITFQKTGNRIVATIKGDPIEVSVGSDVTEDTMNTLINGTSSSGSGSGSSSVSDIVISAALGSSSILATADTLAAGEYIKLEENHIMNNKQLTLSFKISELADGDVIRVGHGETSYAGSYLELTKSTITIYEYYTSLNTKTTLNHGLTIKDYVNLTIDVGTYNVSITLGTSTGLYQSGVINNCWVGRNGEIFAVSTSSDLTDVKMRWNCSDYSESIWIIGDSYFNVSDPARWPYYLVKAGYDNCLMTGFPGRNTLSALNDFKQALTHGTPEYAVWCMGMNDADSATAINASYLSATNEFLSICEKEGITPILSTVPCVPDRNNSFKNEWVMASGYRYIDFAAAVGGEAVGSSWYDGMLYTDNVHPTALGAKALYAQFLADFPEIMRK